MPRFNQHQEGAAKASFSTVERFLTTATETTYDAATAGSEVALQEAFDSVRLKFAPLVIPGTALLQQIESNVRILPFGCQPIDIMLEGGFREGQVMEIYGESGSGKTQLCMMACARAAVRGEHVVYIDTSNAFSGNRLASMIKSITQNNAATHLAMQCVTVFRAYTAHTVLSILDNLLRHHSTSPSTPIQPPPPPSSSPPRPVLVILDSIGAVIAPVLGGGGGTHMQGHAVLASLAMMLKQVAQQLQAAVLVTNHMVGGGGTTSSAAGAGAGMSSSSAGGGRFFEVAQKKPALGESWHNQAHCRMQLSVPVSEGGPWTAALKVSTMSACKSTAAQYWLTSAGAAAAPVPPQ